MSGRVKWEAWLSSEDHAAAETERIALGIGGRAEYLRALIRAGQLTRDTDIARVTGVLGRIAAELDQHVAAGGTLPPELAALRREVPELLLLGCEA